MNNSREKKPRRSDAKKEKSVHQKDFMTYKCQNCGHEAELQIVTKNVSNTVNTTPDRSADHIILSKSVPENSADVLALVKSSLKLDQIDFPLCVEIKHRGFWITNEHGRHEPTLDETCDRSEKYM